LSFAFQVLREKEKHKKGCIAMLFTIIEYERIIFIPLLKGSLEDKTWVF